MNKKIFHYLFCSIAILCLTNCSSRKAILPGEIPEINYVSAEDEQYGHEVLNMMMDQYQLDTNDSNVNRTRNIVNKLAESANSGAAPWHVYVLKDDQFENAAATRGNYIFVWTGMLLKVKDDDELAAVLAHELSHVLAGHTQPTPEEEFSSMISQVGGRIAGEVVSVQGQYGIFASLAGTLTQALIEAILINPEGQRKELEADQIGLFLMARSGYDPSKALELWQRMSTDGTGDWGPVQFLSSHPSSEERVEQIRQLLPKIEEQQAINNTEYKNEWSVK